MENLVNSQNVNKLYGKNLITGNILKDFYDAELYPAHKKRIGNFFLEANWFFQFIKISHSTLKKRQVIF